MTKYLVEKDTLDDLADAIREQTGDENPMKLADFASNVRSISGGTTVTKFTATLTSTQYGWFTFEDENGNVLALNSDNSPLYATAISGSNYYISSFVAYESTNRYLFKIYDINDSSAHGYVGSSKTLTFDMAYIKSAQSVNAQASLLMGGLGNPGPVNEPEQEEEPEEIQEETPEEVDQNESNE